MQKNGDLKMSTDAQKKAMKKANEQRILISVTYRKNDIQEGRRLKAYLEITGQSANSYLKELIKKDLDSKGV